MIRRSTLPWLVLATSAGIALFLIKYEVQKREAELAELNRRVLADQEAIHVLKAEWSYLNRPDRLEPLIHRYLDLVPLRGEQIGSVAVIPAREPASQPTPPPAAPERGRR